jgi:hypothetical protein
MSGSEASAFRVDWSINKTALTDKQFTNLAARNGRGGDAWRMSSPNILITLAFLGYIDLIHKGCSVH